jgi:hypothetical protein
MSEISEISQLSCAIKNKRLTLVVPVAAKPIAPVPDKYGNTGVMHRLASSGKVLTPSKVKGKSVTVEIYAGVYGKDHPKGQALVPAEITGVTLENGVLTLSLPTLDGVRTQKRHPKTKKVVGVGPNFLLASSRGFKATDAVTADGRQVHVTANGYYPAE